MGFFHSNLDHNPTLRTQSSSTLSLEELLIQFILDLNAIFLNFLLDNSNHDRKDNT